MDGAKQVDGDAGMSALGRAKGPQKSVKTAKSSAQIKESHGVARIISLFENEALLLFAAVSCSDHP